MENGIGTVAVFGDSILKGVVTGTGSGKMYDFVSENSLALAADALGFTLKNFSAFGNIITKSQRTLNYQLGKGLTADVVIIESGGNDCNVNWVEAKKAPDAPPVQQVPLPEFLRTVDDMVQTVRAHGMTPVLTSLVPFVPERWFETLCINGDRAQILAYLKGNVMNLYRANELYSIHLADYAHQNRVHFVDFRKYLLPLPDYEDYMCADGIHPNLRGYAFLADVWKAELPKIPLEQHSAP